MMNRRGFFLSCAMAGVMMVTGAVLGQDSRPAKKKPVDKMTAKVGEKAPDFTLKDADGKEYSLSDYEGKVVVLQWINPQCPICKRVVSKGLVENMLKELKEMDKEIVHLAINSSHFAKDDDGQKYFKEYKIESPTLCDQNGKVGMMYGAKTTPHMYVIDDKGVLRYSGAFDDDPRGQKSDSAMNYVLNTVKQIKAGETVTPDTTRPYGCSVKYDPAKKPARGDGRRGGFGSGRSRGR